MDAWRRPTKKETDDWIKTFESGCHPHKFILDMPSFVKPMIWKKIASEVCKEVRQGNAADEQTMKTWVEYYVHVSERPGMAALI